MTRQKIEMQPGKKYRGYALLNEYGEFDFTPEQTGSRAGALKVVKEVDGCKVSTTKNTIQILISLPKLKGMELVKRYCEKMNQALEILQNYDF